MDDALSRRRDDDEGGGGGADDDLEHICEMLSSAAGHMSPEMMEAEELRSIARSILFEAGDGEEDKMVEAAAAMREEVGEDDARQREKGHMEEVLERLQSAKATAALSKLLDDKIAAAAGAATAASGTSPTGGPGGDAGALVDPEGL